MVATVLTVYGIETPVEYTYQSPSSIGPLQQYLPFTVLKRDPYEAYRAEEVYGCNSTYRLRYWNECLWVGRIHFLHELQQYLPFTVLKLEKNTSLNLGRFVATVLTVYGIETNPSKTSIYSN